MLRTSPSHFHRLPSDVQSLTTKIIYIYHNSWIACDRSERATWILKSYLPPSPHQAEKTAATEALSAAQAALNAASGEGASALAESVTLTAQLDSAERAKASLEAQLAVLAERHAAGVQDLDALSRQLASAQAEAAQASTMAGQLQVEVGN